MFVKSVRQGCLLSSMLFSAIGEEIMRLVADDVEEKAGSLAGENMRFADDATLLSTSKTQLENLTCCFGYSETFGLRLNRETPNFMIVHSTGGIKIGKESLEIRYESVAAGAHFSNLRFFDPRNARR